MEQNLNQKYLIEKYQAESLEDLLGRLLFQLIALQNTNNDQVLALRTDGEKNQQTKIEYAETDIAQRKFIESVLAEIKTTIEEKEVDLSEIVAELQSIVETNIEARQAVENATPHYEEITKQLVKIAKLTAENKPLKLDGVIDSQEKHSKEIAKLIVKLTEEVKQKEFPKSLEISNQLEIKKPSWWKEFSFSWEPLKELFEKLKTHTFKVEVKNQAERTEQIDIEKLAKKIGVEVEKAIKKIPRSSGGGMGNPFTFGQNGSVKVETEDENYAIRIVANESDFNVEYVAKAEIGTQTNEAKWQVKKIDKTAGTIITWADGNDEFDNVFDDRETLNYL